MGERGRLRAARLRRGLELAEVAGKLGVETKVLRALEWDRPDLLPPGEAERVLAEYRRFLDVAAPAERAPEAPPAREPPTAPEPQPAPEPPSGRAERPRRNRRAFVAAAVALLAGAGVVAGLVLVATAGSEEPSAAPAQPSTTLLTPPPPPPPAAPVPPSLPARVSVVVAATRGDSWVDARAGSAEGKPLYQATLAQGRSIRFAAAKVWLRLGAASNVEVTLDGKKVGPLFGTVEVVLSRAGLETA